MCENTECEYPFGYEELRFVTTGNDMAIDDSSRDGRSGTSQSGWSELERINQTLTDEDSAINEEREKRKKEIEKANKEAILSQKAMAKDALTMKLAEDLDNLHKHVLQTQCLDKSADEIKTRRFLKLLKKRQDKTGENLVSAEEIQRLKKETPELGLGELKIDIDQGDKSVIKIAVRHADENV